MKILNSHGLQKYLNNTLWLMGEKALRIFAGLFVAVWVARYLGPAEFGVLSFAISFVSLFIAIASFGMDNILIRELVKNDSKKETLLGTAFRLKMLGAFLVFTLLAITISLFSKDKSTNSLIFIIASITIFQSLNVIDSYFQSKVLSKYSVYAKTGALVTGSIVRVILIVQAAPLVAFAWAILIESMILAIGYTLVYAQNNLSLRRWQYNSLTAKYLLKNSWPLLLSGLAISIYMKIDQIMIKGMLGSEFVGQYAAAVQLSEAWYFFAIVISASLFPAIINSKIKDTSLYHDRLEKLYRLMVWIALAIAIPTTFLSDWIIYILYGSDFNSAGEVLRIHIWAGLFVFLGVASGKWLVAENLQIFAFYRTLAGLVINICLNIFLIPRYGINGAAIATLCSQFVAAFIFDLFHPSTRISFLLKLRAFLLYRTINEKNI